MDKQHLDTTLAITQAMADELTDYLMGDSLYRQLVVKTPTGTKQPKMTIGALLENLELLRWEKESLSTGQQAALAAIEHRIPHGMHQCRRCAMFQPLRRIRGDPLAQRRFDPFQAPCHPVVQVDGSGCFGGGGLGPLHEEDPRQQESRRSIAL